VVATNAYVGQIHLVRGEYRAAVALFKRNVESIVGDLTHERFGLPQLPAVSLTQRNPCLEGSDQHRSTCNQENHPS